MTRRRFLGCLAALALAPLTAQAEDICAAPDKTLSLRRGDVELTCTYLRDGKLDFDAYTQLCWLLRDVHAGQQIEIDPALLDMLHSMQEHARGQGYSEVLCGQPGCKRIFRAHYSLNFFWAAIL